MSVLGGVRITQAKILAKNANRTQAKLMNQIGGKLPNQVDIRSRDANEHEQAESETNETRYPPFQYFTLFGRRAPALQIRLSETVQ